MLEPRIEVNHQQLIENLNIMKKKLNADTSIMAIVKSEAYGHGMLEVAESLYDKVDCFGVGFLEEALKLNDYQEGYERQEKKRQEKKDILVMGPCYAFDKVINTNIIMSIESLYQFRALVAFIKVYLDEQKDQKDQKDQGIALLRIHIKLDTGMHRFGFSKEELTQFIEEYNTCELKDSIGVEGVFSHFASTVVSNKIMVYEQNRQFKLMKKMILDKLMVDHSIIFHIANSENAFEDPEFEHDMVRLGNGLYSPIVNIKPVGTKKIAKVLLPITSVHRMENREAIGYGLKKIVRKGRVLAFVQSGFYEGVGMEKAPSGQGNLYILIFYIKRCIKMIIKKEVVLFNNYRLPIVGSINMQFFAIDITGTKASVGDYIEINKAPLYFKESVNRRHIREEKQ